MSFGAAATVWTNVICQAGGINGRRNATSRVACLEAHQQSFHRQLESGNTPEKHHHKLPNVTDYLTHSVQTLYTEYYVLFTHHTKQAASKVLHHES